MTETTIEQAIEQIAHQFSQVDLCYGHGTSNPWEEAAWAVHHVLGIDFGQGPDVYKRSVTPEQLGSIQSLALERIKTRKPMAYLTNKMWFAGLEFYVDERTLVPRSPLAELILNGFAPWIDIEQANEVLDLCTGSGCIGMAIAHYFPHLNVTATDISQDALEVAEINRTGLGLESQVSLCKSDLFKDIPKKQFDLIVSNPPYVANCVVQALPDEYHKEPDLGLVSGEGGLDHVEQILKDSVKFLTDNGLLIVEVGLSMEALSEAHPSLPFMWLEFDQGGEGVFMLTAEQLKAYFKD